MAIMTSLIDRSLPAEAFNRSTDGVCNILYFSLVCVCGEVCIFVDGWVGHMYIRQALNQAYGAISGTEHNLYQKLTSYTDHRVGCNIQYPGNKHINCASEWCHGHRCYY